MCSALVAADLRLPWEIAAYGPTEDGTHRAYGIMVLTMEGDAIIAITGFLGPELFRHFALPAALES
jgi:hypothetical protein